MIEGDKEIAWGDGAIGIPEINQRPVDILLVGKTTTTLAELEARKAQNNAGKIALDQENVIIQARIDEIKEALDIE